MIIQIKNFRNPRTGKHVNKFNTDGPVKWGREKYKFNMNNLDFLDPLINEDGGYVRYCTKCEDVVEFLKVCFGFEEE